MTHREKRSVKPLNSIGIIHNLAQGLQTPVSRKVVEMSACFACYWPAIFVPYVPRGRT